MEKVNSKKIIRLSKSAIGVAEKNAVLGVLDREYLGMGVEVRDFEDALSTYFGRPAICVVNGTAAIHLALQAAGIGDGDEVLVQSMTYVASFQAIAASGARPVACDINPQTMTLNWKDAEKRLTSRTRAVMPVHYGGGVGDLSEIYSFAKENNLRVIEDAAHAFGSQYRNEKVGGFGDVACFSFDGIKNITSGEGGCIVTSDPELLLKAKDARLLGVEKDTDKRFRGERSWDFSVTQQGWRYHMSNIMAAIGIEQLKKLAMMASKRQELAIHYQRRLSVCSRVSMLRNNYREVVPHIFPIILSDGIDRSEIVARLDRFNIQTGIHYKPNHKLEKFMSNSSLPATDRVCDRVLSLPLHFDLSMDDVDYVCDKLMDSIR